MMSASLAELALHAVEFGARRVEYAAVGDGPAVVILHGGNCSADDWANITPRLAQRYRLILPDGLVCPLDPWLIWLLLDHLGVTTAALVGHSAGGSTAREMYRLQPQRVRAFTNIDSQATGGTIRARDLPDDRFSPQAAALYEQHRAEMLQLREDHRGDYPSPVNIEKRLRAYRRIAMTPAERAQTRPPPSPVHRAASPPPAPVPILDDGKFIACPVQVFHTGREKLGPEDISPEWIDQNIQARDVDYVVIREVSHWPWIEQPDLFLAHLEPFLARTSGQ